ncbi:MAG TPA: ATP-binding protein [Candidatus Deferrimicrobiaceae bacterium]|jgi:PAS domain S-box-containing protein
MSSRHATLRAKVLGIILLSILPLVGLSVYFAASQRQLAVSGMQRHLEMQAKEASRAEAQALSGMRQLLAGLALRGNVQQADAARCRRVFAAIVAMNPLFSNIGLTDSGGRVVCNAIAAPRPVELSDRPYFRKAVDTGQFAVGEYQIDRVTGCPSQSGALPVFSASGSIDSVLFASLDFKWMNRQSYRITQELPDGAILTKVDRNGTVLFRYPDPDRLFGKRLPEEALLGIVRSGGGGVREFTGSSGSRQVGFFSRLSHDDEIAGPASGDAYLILEIPRDRLFGPANRQFALNLAALAVVVLLAMGLILGFADRTVLGPLDLGMQVADTLPMLNRDGAAPKRGKFASLTQSIRRMADWIDQQGEALVESRALCASSEERYETLFDAAGDAIFSHEIDGTILDANRTACRWLEYTREELRGMSITALESAGQPADLPARSEELRWSGHISYESEYRTRSGAGIPTEVNARIVTIDGRETILSIARDITKRRRAEEAFRKVADQLRQSQKMEAVGTLAGGIAHDFNNLLTAITGYTQLLLSRLPNHSPMRFELGEIDKAAELATSLTRKLLTFSRKQVVQAKVLDVGCAVAGIEDMLRRLIGESYEMTVIREEALHPVLADPGQIEQIVMNLAINARDAMPLGGSIVIQVVNTKAGDKSAGGAGDGETGCGVLLLISDTGCGIREEILPNIFDPFFTTKQRGQGTGLGLATVHGMVQQLGGTIEVSSSPGAGSTFRVFLPRTNDCAALPAPSPEFIRKPGRQEKTILLVDDSDSIRMLLGSILRSAGYDVTEAVSGEEALRLADIGDPVDLLLSDVVMPGMNGRELGDRLLLQFPGVKVLLMSGYSEEHISKNGVLESGINFLPKPFAPAELLRHLAEMLHDPPHAGNPPGVTLGPG